MVEIAAPIVVTPAFADRDAIWRMLQTHSPYPLMAALAGYGEMMGADLSPWFRSNWLSLATIVDLLRADLAQRGHQVGEPSDPYGDSEWSQVLTNVYMLGR